MASIRHFPATHPLPDWRNFGVMLRVMLGGNLLAALAALLLANDVLGWPARYLELTALVEPMLFLTLALLMVLRDPLRQLPLRLGQLAVVALVAALGLIFGGLANSLVAVEPVSLGRVALLSIAAAWALLFYFELRASAMSPAQSEARLAALNARIRPHFLFNTLNTVLSLIRARPQQAEEALESLADLFRAAMRDPEAHCTLGDELEISRQYFALEQFRLGDRLQVDWQIGDLPLDWPILPLMLQPLLENAVYHGIEPLPEGGRVIVCVELHGDELCISVTNPTGAGTFHAPGNQMALANIRERLALYYDLEARMEIFSGDSSYEVRITLPCHHQNH